MPRLNKSHLWRRRRLVNMPFLGVNMSRPIGESFAPIGHNWLYGFTAKEINDVLTKIGLEATGEKFKFFMGAKRKAQLNHTQEEFKNEILPAVDVYLKTLSWGGSIDFLVNWLALGAFLGFNKTFMYYTLFQIAHTEAISFADKQMGGSSSGNSIFQYTNSAMIILLFIKRGYLNGPILLSLLAVFRIYEHGHQYIDMPWVSILAHEWGTFVGLLSWVFIYKLRLPF